MKVLLETRCGCRREVEWSELGGEIEKPTKHINMPMMYGPFGSRHWYRKFTMVGYENGALRYLEMRISPVWTEDELNNSGPPDIVFDSSLEDKK